MTVVGKPKPAPEPKKLPALVAMLPPTIGTELGVVDLESVQVVKRFERAPLPIGMFAVFKKPEEIAAHPDTWIELFLEVTYAFVDVNLEDLTASHPLKDGGDPGTFEPTAAWGAVVESIRADIDEQRIGALSAAIEAGIDAKRSKNEHAK